MLTAADEGDTRHASIATQGSDRRHSSNLKRAMLTISTLDSDRFQLCQKQENGLQKHNI